MMIVETLPNDQKDIIKEALEMMDANLNNLLKVGVECDMDKLEYLRHDIMTLKALFRYEVSIKMTGDMHERFTLDNKIDYPQYTHDHKLEG
jgi:hypothetical protein